MGCFDFLTRKRKDKKEQKRKDAIAARAERNKYSERRATGGIRFEVVFDDMCRPPTPFRVLTPRIGPSRISLEERLKLGQARREVVLGRRTDFARQSSIRRAEVLQRKEDTDVQDILNQVDKVGDVTPREEGHSVSSSSA